MIEGALSEKATSFADGLKAWLIILAMFGIAVGILIFLGSFFGEWSSIFASVDPGIDSFQMAIAFVVYIGLTVAIFLGACIAGIHLVAGANQLFVIYNRNRANTARRKRREQERLANWKAQQGKQ